MTCSGLPANFFLSSGSWKGKKLWLNLAYILLIRHCRNMKTIVLPRTSRGQPTCVATPTGQVLRWHFLIMVQPNTIRGAVEKPTSSAPSRAAMTTSLPGQGEKDGVKNNEELSHPCDASDVRLPPLRCVMGYRHLDGVTGDDTGSPIVPVRAFGVAKCCFNVWSHIMTSLHTQAVPW